VWTSLGVVAGVAAVAVTGWERLDPMVALIVAANIIWTGAKLVQRSMLALLDGALSASDQAAVKKVLDQSCDEHVQFHALRTRQAGARKFVSVHILVPGEWTVQRGHDLLEQIEEQIRAAVPGANMFTHLEPLEDPVSWQDVGLDRDDES